MHTSCSRIPLIEAQHWANLIEVRILICCVQRIFVDKSKLNVGKLDTAVVLIWCSWSTEISGDHGDYIFYLAKINKSVWIGLKLEELSRIFEHLTGVSKYASEWWIQSRISRFKFVYLVNRWNFVVVSMDIKTDRQIWYTFLYHWRKTFLNDVLNQFLRNFNGMIESNE